MGYQDHKGYGIGVLAREITPFTARHLAGGLHALCSDEDGASTATAVAGVLTDQSERLKRPVGTFLRLTEWRGCGPFETILRQPRGSQSQLSPRSLLSVLHGS
jgi:hypothetical protein